MRYTFRNVVSGTKPLKIYLPKYSLRYILSGKIPIMQFHINP